MRPKTWACCEANDVGVLGTPSTRTVPSSCGAAGAVVLGARTADHFRFAVIYPTKTENATRDPVIRSCFWPASRTCERGCERRRWYSTQAA